MDWKTVRNSGYIASQASLLQNQRNTIAVKFLEGVVKEFARASRRYFDLVNELPFIYRERQMHTVLLPAITEIAGAALGEMPVTRRIEDGIERWDSHGWVDYWACYQEVDFLIEVKHRWHAARSKKVNSYTRNGWHNLAEQFNSLTAEAKKIYNIRPPVDDSFAHCPLFPEFQR